MAESDYFSLRPDISAICVRPRFCEPLTCDTGLYARYGHKFIDFPESRNTTVFPIGSNTTLRCNADPNQPRTTIIKCQPPGFWIPNPESKDVFSCLPTPPTLPPSTSTTLFPADDTPWNPKYFASCIQCFQIGTSSCDLVDGHGWVCLCKEGWTNNACFNSPKFCPRKPCKNGGECKEYVDRAVCTCVGAWKGDTCERNSARFEFWNSEVKWNNILDTFGLLWLIIGALLVGVLALIPPESGNESQDPQSTYQRHRGTVIAIGASLMLMLRHPDILNIDRWIGCRMAYYLIHSFYCTAAWGMFWESMNFKNVINIEHFNTWTDRHGKHCWWYSNYFRLSSMYLLGFIPSFIISWAFSEDVLRPWTCVGTFDWDSKRLWINAINIQLVPCWLAVIFAESGSVSLRDLKHLNVKRMYIWEVFRTTQLGTHYYFVERDWPFVISLPVIHFFSWISVILSTDFQIIQLSLAGCIFNIIYGNLLFIQQLYCRPKIHSWFLKQMMLRLPARWGPKFDHFTGLSREEVISNHRRSIEDPKYSPPTARRLNEISLRGWIQKYLIVRCSTNLDVRDSLNAVRLWDVDGCYTNFSSPEMKKMWQQFVAARYADDNFDRNDANFQQKMREAMLIHPNHLADNPESCMAIVKHKTLESCLEYGTKIKSPPVILKSQLYYYLSIYRSKMDEFNSKFQAKVQEAERKRAEKLTACPEAAHRLTMELHQLAAQPLSLEQLNMRMENCPPPEVDIPAYFFNTRRPYFIGPLTQIDQPGPAKQENFWQKTKAKDINVAYRGHQSLGYFNVLKLFLGIGQIRTPFERAVLKLSNPALDDKNIQGRSFSLESGDRQMPPSHPVAYTQ
uniref:EGF-like domain-containing protein n=1 Tax=Plectus sambesii TaxID=2011161 RepID=A0A914WB95_9BILA